MPRVECAMTYRDDLDAARHRREALARQLDDVRARLGDRDALLEEERRLAAQLEDTTSHIEHARKRVDLPLLRDVRIASPCKESWDAMTGDDRVRFCGRCEKSVFDLSEMTAVEAESVLATHGAAACVRFFRRADGTVMTSDCPESERRFRRRKLMIATALAAGTLAGAGALLVGDDEPRPMVYGGGPMYDGLPDKGSDMDYAVMGGSAAPPPEVYTPPIQTYPIDAMLPDHPSLTDPDWEPSR